MRDDKSTSGDSRATDDDDEPEGKPVTGILLGIGALFLLVVALQIIQRC